jgi:protein-S-isoprenylcysteine O-methyltransferase Ste14
MKKAETDAAPVAAPPPLLMFALLGAGLLMHLVLPLGLACKGLATRALLSLIPFNLSGILALWASMVLRRRQTPVNPKKPTTAIVTDGPYRFTRNPLYLSLLLLYAGFTVLLCSLWPLLIFPLLFAVFHYGLVLREEAYLEKKFGPRYLDYKKRVRRWI